MAVVLVVVAVLTAVIIPLVNDAKAKAQDNYEIQSAKDAYTNYMIEHADELEVPRLFLYEASEGKVIAVEKGEIVGTYTTSKEAIIDLIGGVYKAKELNPTTDSKLFTYGREIAIFSDYTSNPYAGKSISILGDSISTYINVSNNPDYNSTIGENAVYYGYKDMDVTQSETWWQQVIDALDMKLCVDNAWSGSYALQERNGTKGAYVDRCVQLHNDNTGEEPDVIVVFIGSNDFSYYQSTLGTADIDYDALTQPDVEPTTACEAYAVILHKISVRYPNAQVICMSLLPRRVPDSDGLDVVPAPTEFNKELTEIAQHFGYRMVDLENCGITPDPENFDRYIADRRVHPNEFGMDLISNALIKAMTAER